jgi:23S rRNA (cytosine1962-C5)-methyltransferase
MAMARVILKPRRARPFFGMHPWVFAGALAAVEGAPADGDVVDLVCQAGNFVARGLYNSRSNIRVRLYTWSERTTLDEDFFRARLRDALHLRQGILGLSGPGRGTRLVFSEADGLSGLIVDQYDDYLAVQFTSLALATRRALFVDLLNELQTPRGIYLRTERGIGQLEGLDLQDGLLSGTAPPGPLVIEEEGLRFQVHLAEGQKTGFYLDQRDNRAAIARLAPGRRVLDAFCYSGGFGLHAARAGAAAVLGIDVSAPALSLARANAELNGLTNIAFEQGDVFDKLEQLAQAGERFGLIVLDPPKFARAGAAVEEALRGYRRLLSRSLRLLEKDGLLAMCCCTGLIAREALHEVLAHVAAEGRTLLQILESRGAAPDHPVAATCPETSYLKCVVCRIAPS